MTPQRMKWVLLIVPGIVTGGFETFRHTLLQRWLPMELGNWVTAVIASLVIALISRRLFSQYDRSRQELSAEREVRAVLEDRERMARELHDHIAQTVFYAGVQIQTLQRSADKLQPEALTGKLGEVLLSLREIDGNIRQSIYNLKQGTTMATHFAARVRHYLRDACAATGLSWEFRLGGTVPELDTSEEVQLFGILQEAVTNIHKHARASRVSVSLETAENGRDWIFAIRDDGAGFDPNSGLERHFGLEIMAGRARDIGGEAVVLSGPDGTEIRICKTAPVALPATGRLRTAKGLPL